MVVHTGMKVLSRLNANTLLFLLHWDHFSLLISIFMIYNYDLLSHLSLQVRAELIALGVIALLCLDEFFQTFQVRGLRFRK